MLRSFRHITAALGGLLIASLSTTALSAPDAGVKTLPSGVQVKFLKTAEGKKPAASDTVLVHYEGRLTDGTVFDSSYKRGKPISFPLRGVIPCWTQGVAEMPVGSTVELTCPSETAYGKRGAGGVIPPDATLLFKVELLGIN